MAQLPHTARIFSKFNKAASWGWQEIYLAQAVDGIHTIIWMNSKDAKNKSKRPESVIPKEIRDEFKRASKPKDQVEMSIDEVKNLLARKRK